MMQSRKHTVLASFLLVALFAGSVLALRKIQSLRGNQATLEDVLYLPSGKTIKRMSLGYSGLLADIYWTRAVQYFGSKHLQHSQHYDLLYPLLDIATDLDPHIIVAYEYGSVFLSQKPPEGAGEPDKAVALIQKGIRENPQYWRLYFNLGFVNYMNRHDPRAAQDAFEKGSEVPGALPWMKVMAARMAEHSKDPSTAAALWGAILQSSSDHNVQSTARLHLDSLKADLDIKELESRVQIYREKTGSLPADWTALETTGLLHGIPLDPNRAPYRLMPDGKVEVQDASKYPYLGEWLYNQVRPF
jgi:tetratricopeptide (TPR) repeat protein